MCKKIQVKIIQLNGFPNIWEAKLSITIILTANNKNRCPFYYLFFA